MSAIKCRNCGLVNFSTEIECKRCKKPIAGKSGGQQTQNFLSPPPPPVFDQSGGVAYVAVDNVIPPCIKCGKQDSITVQSFRKVYNSPVALLGIVLGLLPYFILKLLLRTVHNLTAPFCQPCWKRFRNVEALGILNTLAFFVLLIAGIIFSIVMDSEWLLLGSLLMPILVYFTMQFYLSSISPKYKRVTSKEVIIDAPHVGQIVYSR